MNRDLSSRVHWPSALGLMWCISAVLLLSRSVTAQSYESPIYGEFGVSFGSYLPEIDDEFNVVGPWEVMFGPSGTLLSEIEYSHYVWREHGALAIGLSIGFLKSSGQSLYADRTKSPDDTTFRMVPVRLSVIYRYDDLPRLWRVPLVPYVELGLDATFWWITSSAGVSTYRDPNTLELDTGENLTWGWHTAIGLQFQLDVLAPSMSRSFDTSSGVNNTYIFAEWLYADVDNFGSSESMKVGGSAFMFGLAFEF